MVSGPMAWIRTRSVPFTVGMISFSRGSTALAARAIRDEKNVGTLVTEILEAAAETRRASSAQLARSPWPRRGLVAPVKGARFLPDPRRSCRRYPTEPRNSSAEPTRRDPRHHPSSRPGHPTHQISHRRLRRAGLPRLVAFRGSRR